MASNERKTLSTNNLRPGRRVLIVEDERDLADLLKFNLERSGYRAAAVYDGKSALRSIESERPDLVILDVMIPELSGTEVASRIRTNPATTKLPIVMLTAKADEVDQLVGLAVGADDYITKPFSVKLLLARIEALLRRTDDRPAGDKVTRLGGIEVDLDAHQAKVDGAAVHLTLTEFRLLAALVQAPGRVLSRRHLMTKAMGPGVTVTERTIDVHLTAIRKKLGQYGNLIATVRGVGYRASPEPQDSEV